MSNHTDTSPIHTYLPVLYRTETRDRSLTAGSQQDLFSVASHDSIPGVAGKRILDESYFVHGKY
jgi:hypothetical protein